MSAQPEARLKGSARLGTYLRRLRSGYGYSLRRVEECARAEGGEIDNSQLSRYEKGICYPSFDKLRVLANVFNVSIQSFSDIVDLEAYESLKPSEGAPDALIDQGIDLLRAGENGQAFAFFETAIEALTTQPASSEIRETLGRARVNQAAALIRLGKLALAEQELRSALRIADRLSPELRARALVALANIHADLGDHFLSEMEADKAHQIARSASCDRVSALALHTMARVLADQGRHKEAIERFRAVASLYATVDEPYEALRVRINIGICYASLGKSREGIRLIRTAMDECRTGGHRRLEAFAWSGLGKAFHRVDQVSRARHCFRESDALAVFNDEKQPDILFFNAFYEWQMAIDSGNPTREKMAFGRLKALRSSLERKFPEVDEFDEYVEGGRNHA